MESKKKNHTSHEKKPTSKLVHGVKPHRLEKPKKKLAPTDPTTPGSGAGSFPNFLYQGGPVVSNPEVYIVFLGDWSSSANQTRATRLKQFVTDLLNSSYMNILSQYGCGSTGTVKNTLFLPNTTTPLTHDDLTTILQNAINSTDPAKHLPEPTASQVCILYLDDNTAVDDESAGAVMCEASSDTAFGYHTFFTTTAGNPFFFAVIPGLTDTCLSNSCPDGDSTCTLKTTQTQEQRQTSVTSHEFSEMLSNPQNSGSAATSKLAWIDLTDPSPLDPFGVAGENGDICAGTFGTITVGLNTWTVQMMYSKLEDQESNGSTTCVTSESSPLPSLLPAVSLILDRSTFGKDEVQTRITAGNATYQDAIYVAVDGYTPDELGLNTGNLSSPPNVPTFSGSFTGFGGDPSILFDSATGVQLSDPSKLFNIQRITFPFNIKFNSLNAFAGLSDVDPSQTYSLSAHIVNSTTAAGYPTVTSPASSIAEIELVFQADPFMDAGETWWLSNDMRVFQVTPATLPASKIPLAFSSTAFTSDPNTYIKALISELNTNFTDTATINTPFNGISADEDQSALNLTGNDGHGNPVYNFALARVHLQGDTANNVRAFFRLFISSSPDTDFNTSTTFRRTIETDSSNNNIAGSLIPLLGFPTNDMPSTIPFFAEARIDTTSVPMSRQTDPANVQTIPSPTAPVPAPGAEVYAYFGCWLDLNQSTPRFPINPSAQANPDGPYSSGAIQSIPALIMSNHACLVTEIAYDADPIPQGANAGTSDKIGQRNLQWSGSDNPGPKSGHIVPTLFDLRPTSLEFSADQLPDELMIQWGNTPAGSVASIYWPQLNADDVLQLASRFYTTNVLTKKDAHTIQCVTGGVTYIPIPQGTGASLAGLVTVDLPLTVKVGQEFNIVVKRLRSFAPIILEDSPKSRRSNATDQQIGWRYVVGAFQIRVPVSTGPKLLPAEESLLALFKWKLEQIPTTNRWYTVLQRYIDLVAGRVTGFGGDPGSIGPSQGGFNSGGNGKTHHHPHHHEGKCEEYTGKVVSVIYDRFGDFEGFVLVTEEGHEHCFRGREPEIERLVRYAWDDRAVITVFVEKHSPEWPVSIVLRRSPKSLGH